MILPNPFLCLMDKFLRSPVPHIETATVLPLAPQTWSPGNVERPAENASTGKNTDHGVVKGGHDSVQTVDDSLPEF
jgi:hypothetical protein